MTKLILMTAGCSPLVYKKVEVGTVRAEIFQRRREKHRRHTEFEMETGSDVKSLVFMKLADRRVGCFLFVVMATLLRIYLLRNVKD